MLTMLECWANSTMKCTHGQEHRQRMAARYSMPAPVPSAQNVLPRKVCRGEAAVPSCRLLRLPSSGIFSIVSFPCNAGRAPPNSG